ncbi:Probable cobalt transporter subunit (CbtA) [Actinacidiphila yanglinensis]|uniref:Probable cobalt transporter subunit (CbtA) n=1 Tax=Actinacidiphila yanglinensis TaxID=310779 RepID=A0A1H6CB85_9ACTN|nr:CbtA family protein [Actinacidiphila yanglinensis]SEG69925.1 Probable cobalt transporter subunit (CbtA) [Actinacidiphila yanglinensis]
MEKRLILRGVLAGALAGLLAFVFARIFAEPQIGRAIDYENGRDAAQAALDKAAGLPVDPAGPDLFSRTVQADVGIGVGLILFGVAMGAIFAVVYTVCLGRVGNLRPRTLALLVAGGGFLGFSLVPFLKYPANPPAIGHEETIRARTGLYLIMVVCSITLLALAVWCGQRLKERFGTWNATLLAGAAFAVAIGVVIALLPPLGHLAANREHYGDHATETPLPLTDPHGRIVYPGFPADVLFQFRLYSVAAQLLMWSAIGLVFAPLAERVLHPAPAVRAAPAPRADPMGV